MKYFERINPFVLIASFMAIQLFANVEQQQPKLYISTIVAAILLLLVFKQKIKKISGVFLIVGILTIIDIYIGFIPGINEITKAWIEQSVIVSLAIIISIILALSLDDQKKIELLHKGILIFSCLIFFSALYEFLYLKTQPGRIITGYQNISSAVLLIAIPLILRIKNFNIFTKFIIIITIFVTIAFLFKSRFSTIIGLIYIIYLIFAQIKVNILYRLTFACGLVAVSIGAFSFTDRFTSLLSGNDLWVRYFIWERLLTAGANNFIFGYGFGNISILTSSWQFINPSIELITTFNTFFSAHNELIERFIYGGLISVIIFIVINILIFFGYYKYKKYELKDELIIYLILLAHSLIDIHNSNLSSLIMFNFFQFYLINKIYDNSIISPINLNFLLLFLLIPGFIFIFYNRGFKDHVREYQVVTNNMISGNINEYDIDKVKGQSPHFMRLDFIDMQTYLMFKSGQNFNRTLFETKLLITRRYNKYYLPQIHVSSQYYSFTNDDKNLLLVYSDFLFYKLVNMRIFNISKNSDNIQARLTDDKFISIINNNNSYSLLLPRHTLDELKRVNSSFGVVKLSSFILQQNLDSFIYTGDGDALIHKNVVKEFLEGINTFSDKFVFK